jgi:hypothetical protein
MGCWSFAHRAFAGVGTNSDDKSAPEMIQSLWYMTPVGQAAPLRLVKPVKLKS